MPTSPHTYKGCQLCKMRGTARPSSATCWSTARRSCRHARTKNRGNGRKVRDPIAVVRKMGKSRYNRHDLPS